MVRAVGGVSVVNGIAYLASQTSPTGTVLALSAKTGKQLWSAPTTSGNSSDSAPIIVGGSVYVTDSDIGDGHGYLIRYAAP